MVNCPKFEIKEIKNTVLHEIAHALTPGHNHDHVWQAKAVSIGCDGERYYRGGKTFAKEKKEYKAICESCGFSQSKFLVRSCKSPCLICHYKTLFVR